MDVDDRRAAERRLAKRAHAQFGIVTSADVLACGLSRRWLTGAVAARRLVEVHRGVYAFGHRHLPREGTWLAAVLACGPGAALSHRSAGVHWELCRARGSRIDVTIPSRSHRARPGLLIHRSPTLSEEDVTQVRGMRITTPARTMIDLAEKGKVREVERVLDQAVVARLFDLVAIEAAIARSPGRHGSRRLARVIASHESGTTLTESELEEAFLALARRAGLPRARSQMWMAGRRVDFAWPDAGIAIECHSHRYHRARVEADHAKAAALAAEGIHLLAFTHAQIVHRPDEVLAAILGALRRAG